jgi:hypothetical protein
MSESGPILPTRQRNKIGSFPGYTDRDGNLLGGTAPDPEPTSRVHPISQSVQTGIRANLSQAPGLPLQHEDGRIGAWRIPRAAGSLAGQGHRGVSVRARINGEEPRNHGTCE